MLRYAKLQNGLRITPEDPAMDHYDLAYAREHLGELLDRAARGEVVSITDPERGTFR